MQTLRTVNTSEREIKDLTISKVMKILFLGDSITAGAGLNTKEEMFTTLVGKLTNAQIVNYGVGGTRIARNSAPSEDPSYDNDFLRRAEDMDKTADFVFVFGGTNDYGHGDAPIGNENDDSPYTFHGGLNNVIKRLCEIYGKDKIVFMLPTRRFDEEDLFGEGHRTKPTLNLKGYVDIIRAKCEKLGIDYIDLYNDGIPKPETNTGDEFSVDGLHPNDKGHLLIAERIKKYLGL